MPILERVTGASLLVHEGLPLAPHDAWGAWSGDPGIVMPLALAAILHHAGAVRRGHRLAGGLHAGRRAVAFWIGWSAMVVALVAPLHAMGEVLFWAHMTQHEILMTVAAPLLVLARPLVTWLWALPLRWRKRASGWTRAGWWRTIWGFLTRVDVALVLHAVVLTLWHLPGAYQRTLDSDLIHSLQHASFLAAALLFWWSVFHGSQARSGAAILSLFATAVYTTMLGALLALARTPWYPAYAATTSAWGLTPLEDQQLAGVVMWVPGGIAYLFGALAILSAWLRASEHRAGRPERAAAG
jgi:cytochrome c oxidase assembly factor CtaG